MSEPIICANIENIQSYIYFNPNTLPDTNITDIIQDEIIQNASSFWQVIPNNSPPSQFAEIISEIALNMKKDETNDQNNLCLGSIDKKKAIKTMSNADVIITIRSKTTANDLYGFAVVNFSTDGTTTMYLELICTNKKMVGGGGEFLIKILDKMGHILLFKNIKLFCINDKAYKFYKKVGFVEDYTPSFGMCNMTKNLRRIQTEEEKEEEIQKLLECDEDDVDIPQPKVGEEHGGMKRRKSKRCGTNKRTKSKRKSRKTNKRTKSKRKTKRMK
jgi:hypothetical protein